jgi:predicted DNA-binding transcriptional regulator YafY
MPRKKETITLSIPPGTKEQLEAIADRLGIRWGKNPSISGLLVAIAQQQLEVGEPFTFSSIQVQTLQQAMKVLIDSGFVGHAQILSQLLLERGNLETPLRQTVMQQLSEPATAWRIQVENYIRDRQPFFLRYRNAQAQEYTYNVRYAQIDLEEKRFYLNIWCDETDDLPTPYEYHQLIHNRCLSFPRIISMVPTEGKWRQEGLDSIEVQLHFGGGMVKAYAPRESDIDDKEIGKIRQVVRRVSNPFWLLREVRRYGKDCIIVAPEHLRQLRRQELLAECQAYGLEIPPAD